MTPSRAIVLGGLTVGLLDGLDAIIFFGLRGVHPARIFQAISAGLLGRESFAGGLGTTLLGVLLHFCIATTIVAVFLLASRTLPNLSQRPFLWGPLYGLGVWVVMNCVVIPASANPGGARPTAVVVNGILIHLVGVGLPAALFARAAGRAGREVWRET